MLAAEREQSFLLALCRKKRIKGSAEKEGNLCKVRAKRRQGCERKARALAAVGRAGKGTCPQHRKGLMSRG